MESVPHASPPTFARPRRCVVTGSAGFIGSQLCKRLVRDGWSVVGIDGFIDSYDPVEKVMRAASLARVAGISLIVGDLVELDLVEAFKGAEVVFHLAGRAGGRASFSGERRYVHDNILATSGLSRPPPGRTRRVVYASSSSVYGDGETPFREDAVSAPISPYGRTKLEAEHLCLGAAGADLEAVALRYFTVYGPGQRPDMGLRLFAEAALTGRPITLLGDGTQRRDFTYVCDTVAATAAAADAPTSGLAINVGGGSDVSILDVLDLLRGFTGKNSSSTSSLSPGVMSGLPRPTSAGPVPSWASRLRFPSMPVLSAEVAWVRERLDHQIGSFRMSAPITSLSACIPIPHDTYGLGHLRRNLVSAASCSGVSVRRGRPGFGVASDRSGFSTSRTGLVQLPRWSRPGMTRPLDHPRRASPWFAGPGARSSETL